MNAPTLGLDTRELYRRASAEFIDRVHCIAGRWEAPTPCPGWDVRTLVRHVVAEQRWAPPLLAGQTIAQVGDRLAGDLLGADPVAASDQAAAAALAAIADDYALDRVVHLSVADTPGAEYVMQLAADHLVHAWDLACALGDDAGLDAQTVAEVRDWFGPAEAGYRQAGMIGPRAALPPDPTPQDELLAMFGRAPALAAVARFTAAFASGDVETIMATMTPNPRFEDTAPPDGRRHTGAAAVRAAWQALFAAAPQARFTTEEIIPAGERVIARWRYDWGDGHVRGIDVFTVRAGLVAEKLAYVKG